MCLEEPSTRRSAGPDPPFEPPVGWTTTLDRLILFDCRSLDPMVLILSWLFALDVLDEFEAVGVLSIEELVEFNVPLGLSVLVGGGRGSLRLNQACLKADEGFIRVAGSHSRHLRMKSRNKGSSQPFRAV